MCNSSARKHVLQLSWVVAELWLSCGSLMACGIPFGIAFGVAFGVNQVSAGTEDVNTTRQSLRKRISLMQQISSKLPKNCAFRPPAVLTRSNTPFGLQISVILTMILKACDLQWFALICTCFITFFEGRQGLICSDLQGANQVQIRACDLQIKALFQGLWFADHGLWFACDLHVICSDLQGVVHCIS